MNLASKIQNSVQDPMRWIGRRARACRKHGDSIHYITHLGQIGCLDCDQPDASRISLRVHAHDGVWSDADCGFDIEAPQRATESLEIGSTVVQGDSTYQIMPVDANGNPISWYEYDRDHGKPPSMPYEAYVVLRWIMTEFNESDLPPEEVRYGRSRSRIDGR